MVRVICLGVASICAVAVAITLASLQPHGEHHPVCPHCGRSDQILVLVYGLSRTDPPPGFVKAGCVITKDSPMYKCGACGTEFGRIAP